MSNQLQLCVTRALRNGVTVTGIFSWRGSSWRTAELVELIRPLPGSYTEKDLRDAFNEAQQATKSPAAWNRQMVLAFCKWVDANGDFDELKTGELRNIAVIWKVEDGDEAFATTVQQFLDRRKVNL